jgi:hypothetical protein
MVGSSQVKHSGDLLVEIFRADGTCTKIEAENLVVDSGLAWIADRMTSTPGAMSHMAIGAHGEYQAYWNSGLGTELKRVAFDSVTRNGATITYVATFPPRSGTGFIAELGIFNSASGGTMLSRTTINPQDKGDGDTIKVTWNIRQAV